MVAAIQFLTRPRDYDYVVVSGDWRHARVREELVWSKRSHRVVVNGLSPAQARRGDRAHQAEKFAVMNSRTSSAIQSLNAQTFG
jgi:hypothetical protein